MLSVRSQIVDGKNLLEALCVGNDDIDGEICKFMTKLFLCVHIFPFTAQFH